MAELLLHCAAAAPYCLGPAHALLALDGQRRGQAVHLLEGLRASWGAHEAFSVPRLLREVAPADAGAVLQALTDLLVAGALLVAVTPLPGGVEGRE